MSENVFFNPGQSVSSDYDFDKAYVAAKIYHDKSKKPVVVVREKDGQPYLIFDEQAAQNTKLDENSEYSIIKRVDD
ncbi:hypothetical protein [Ligilactobacillus acidipiscis]|jgi:hypothetical protein|uniref:Uncharacterized protein n=1 Tax=Ligilactobacillus acidipiscis TaxID=89059 RepID=A0A921FCK0_9LACO|nr:hypothetical protein [Ligilactobacillus acidipiscis]MCI1924377.1 hypothetical protein [Ligilactobacillus acidipiscis]MCI1953887.1 hypothetical protein [Ligilactobacillus acidipiscis]WEV57696.1 hypothetical protein OZX66_03890 [Ligilactobacillus acidipiscis]HJE97953.1 hypothetical protein [Ligilactobacillus acidipiscis]